jgi:hypothetical protein
MVEGSVLIAYLGAWEGLTHENRVLVVVNTLGAFIHLLY